MKLAPQHIALITIGLATLGSSLYRHLPQQNLPQQNLPQQTIREAQAKAESNTWVSPINRRYLRSALQEKLPLPKEGWRSVAFPVKVAQQTMMTDAITYLTLEPGDCMTWVANEGTAVAEPCGSETAPQAQP